MYIELDFCRRKRNVQSSNWPCHGLPEVRGSPRKVKGAPRGILLRFRPQVFTETGEFPWNPRAGRRVSQLFGIEGH
jgi:hypothetical protein